MASSTAKRVVAYRFDRQPLEGFVYPATFLLDKSAELLSPSGSVQTVSYSELKAICFVGEGGHFDLFQAHTLFERRPRFPGLWTRFTLRDGDQIDGVLPHNLAEWPVAGYLFTPPRPSSLRQRVFLPREALIRTEFQAVIGSGGSRTKRVKKAAAESQLEMFE